MDNGINFYQTLVRFQEPSKFKGGCVRRLEEFTDYDALVAVINPIDAINVDISSYCFDHGRVREAMNKFINAISAALNVRCSYSQDNITESSKELVGWMVNEPIRDVSYYIEIRQ